ncbi:branched-chain amino acid transport system II carrier protein [Chitinasiproducens palmae]|uniref:Branched-chain amino acid transport system carrier protein n=1 Tax=Chitinasiproducens palmae TaxID=1770053 RepID=A0A1H2PPH2_9BURK|nr:branched-chain amino acid transport system II carrier protein [Chitinasiproducens palmae]SDV48625.1 branched-chain amino acid:cation transporter, LIVCS family [Chitinasiproducens palmae]
MSAVKLSRFDVCALGFMTFALFVGAGNIIFPPNIGLHAGASLWAAAAGFLVTAVGLPVVTLVALARVGGALDELSRPLGRVGSVALAVVCYLAVGPLFATPRTATVSFEVGIAPLTGGTPLALGIYSVVYFAGVLALSLYPGRLLDWVGKVLAPMKMVAIGALCLSAVVASRNGVGPIAAAYRDAPFRQGFNEGYLTMDALGALVFGIVVVNAVRSRGVTRGVDLTRYTCIAALIAGTGLAAIYLGLFRLGSISHAFAGEASNGAAILHAYVDRAFGPLGDLMLAGLIVLACVVTAVGLTCACAEFFSELLGLPYRPLAVGLAVFSLVVSNLGLDALVAFSVPVLTTIYPPCIALVLVSFGNRIWRSPRWVAVSSVLIALAVGGVDGLRAAHLIDARPAWMDGLPFAASGLAWLPPVVLIVLLGFADAAWRRRPAN